MATLTVESIGQLQTAVAALRAAGLNDDHIAVKTLLDKIERAKGNEKAWLAKLEEIPALINAKIRRVRSTADAERSYDHDKLHSELPAIIEMLKKVASVKPDQYVAPETPAQRTPAAQTVAAAA